MTVLSGQPAALLDRANGYLTSAALIDAAADDLRSLAAEGASLALDRVRARTTAAVALLDEAHVRYRGTAQALHEYAVSLQLAHVRAEHAAAEARLRGSQSEAAVGQARQEVEAAQRDLDSAAQLAIARIDTAISATNNTRWERVAKPFDDLGDVVPELWTAFVELIANLVEVAITAILLVVAALVTLVLIVVAIVVLLALVVTSAAVGAVAAWIVSSALIAILSSPLFWLTLLAAEALAAFVLVRAHADTLKPTPAVRPYSDEDATASERLAHRSSQRQTEMAGLGHFLKTAEHVDRLGGDRPGEADHKSVIDIKNTGGEPPHWVVTMPSTQDWQALGAVFGQTPGLRDAGSVTDVDTNVALMAFPGLRTQYERAVLEAMRAAGIGPADPVMLVGFSQGGILAGHLAANRADEFNFVRVIAAGAPVDHMDFPQHSRTGQRVHVMSIQHAGDPVPAADGTAPRGDAPHVDDFLEIARDRFGEVVEGADAHNVGLYQATLERLSERDPSLDDAFRDFMGPVAEHQQYEFAE